MDEQTEQILQYSVLFEQEHGYSKIVLSAPTPDYDPDDVRLYGIADGVDAHTIHDRLVSLMISPSNVSQDHRYLEQLPRLAYRDAHAVVASLRYIVSRAPSFPIAA